MSKNKITTLLPVNDYENEILENTLIEYYLTSNEIIIFDELLDVIDNNDYIEIIDKYNRNMNKSAEYLKKFFVVLNDKLSLNEDKKIPIEDKFLKKIMEFNNGDLFPINLGPIKVSNNNGKIVLSHKNQDIVNFTSNFDITILENNLITFFNKYYLNINKKTISNSSFKFVFGESDQTSYDYLAATKKLLDRIEIKNSFIEFSKNMNKTLEKIENNQHMKDIITNIFGKGRATIREELKDSIIVTRNSNGIETIGLEKTDTNLITDQIAINQINEKNKIIENFSKAFTKNINISKMEVDKETSIIELTNLLNILEKQKIELGYDVILKIRKLGNYNASGLEIQKNDGTILVAIDQRKPFSLIHEFGHVIYENKFIKNEEFTIFAEQLTNILKSKMSNIPLEKKEYYYKPTEIFARASEIAYMLNLMNYHDLVKEDSFSEKPFFTKEILEKIKNKEFETNGLIKEFEHYFTPENKGIYFNLEKLSIQELTTIYIYLQDNFKYVSDVNNNKEFTKKDLEGKTFNITVSEQISKLINQPKKEDKNAVMFKFEKNNKGIDVNNNFYKPIVEILEKLYKNLYGDLHNGNDVCFNQYVAELDIRNLKNSLFYKLITSDNDIEMYTNSSEFVSNVKNYYIDAMDERKGRNLLSAIEYNKFKDDVEKLNLLKVEEQTKFSDKIINVTRKTDDLYNKIKKIENLKGEIYNLETNTKENKLINSSYGFGSIMKIENLLFEINDCNEKNDLLSVFKTLDRTNRNLDENKSKEILSTIPSLLNVIEKEINEYKKESVKTFENFKTETNSNYFEILSEYNKSYKTDREMNNELEKVGRNNTLYIRNTYQNLLNLKKSMLNLNKLIEKHVKLGTFFTQKERINLNNFINKIEDIEKTVFPYETKEVNKKELFSGKPKEIFTYENLFGKNTRNYFNVLFDGASYTRNIMNTQLTFLTPDITITPYFIETSLLRDNKQSKDEIMTKDKKTDSVNYLIKNYDKLLKEFKKEIKNNIEIYIKENGKNPEDKKNMESYFKKLSENILIPFERVENSLKSKEIELNKNEIDR